ATLCLARGRTTSGSLLYPATAGACRWQRRYDGPPLAYRSMDTTWTPYCPPACLPERIGQASRLHCGRAYRGRRAPHGRDPLPLRGARDCATSKQAVSRPGRPDRVTRYRSLGASDVFPAKRAWPVSAWDCMRLMPRGVPIQPAGFAGSLRKAPMRGATKRVRKSSGASIVAIEMVCPPTVTPARVRDVGDGVGRVGHKSAIGSPKCFATTSS